MVKLQHALLMMQAPSQASQLVSRLGYTNLGFEVWRLYATDHDLGVGILQLARFCGQDNKGDNGIANEDGAVIILNIIQEKDRAENNSHALSLALPVAIHA